MIRMVTSTSASHAKKYFSDALQKSDYYTTDIDQELKGRFQGKLAERLGINGEASKEAFFALCENRNPVTGKRLTPNTKETRRIGYDINFHAPKSLSLLHALSEDNHLLEAFRQSVDETMLDIEADSQTRVRKGGVSHDRPSGELVWGEFTHQTARPADGRLPDPHLHTHCFVVNATWDEEEKMVKAGQFGNIKRDMPYYQVRFHKRLSDRLMGMGYRIRQTKSSFEIEGVPLAVIDLFSKRTDEIGRIAKEKGIHDAKRLDALGALTRSKKQKGHTMKELVAEWRKQIWELGEEGKGDGRPLRQAARKQKEATSPYRFINHALKHCFERASVMADRRILRVAYYQAIGDETVSMDDLTTHFKKDERVIRVGQGGQTLCTTKDVLGEERRMVALAHQSRNKFLPLYATPPAINLKDEQWRAAAHVLTTTHGVSIIRGAAGTGKTRMMKETVELIEKAGKKVTVVAPTAQASRGVLQDEGFKDATTIASLLSNPAMQENLKGGVLWVDEAGLLGTGDMKRILEVTAKQQARLILGGDTRQHASVVRGDALRILNTVAGIRCAEMNTIRRQRNARYREAVQDLSKGDVVAGFEKLDAIGSIKAVDPLNPNKELVNDYVEATKKKKDALIISPTHKQGEDVTRAVRSRLRELGLIGKREITATRLVNCNLTEAEKDDFRNFKEGQVVQFNQNSKVFARGSAWAVQSVKEGKLELLNEQGRIEALLAGKAPDFDVFDKSELAVAGGDKMQVTRNGFDERKRRLNNGMTLRVQSVSKSGKIVAKSANGKITYELDKEFGHIDHAHCITSYAAQGRSVDRVFIAQPSATFGATDARQFYVSVSRAKEAATIYTDDKAALLEYASEVGNRQSAIELVASKPSHESYVEFLERAQIRHFETKQDKQKVPLFPKRKLGRDYEPGV